MKIAKFLDELNEGQYDISRILTSHEKEFLSYLVHDKSHVIDNTNKVPELDSVFMLMSEEICSKPLYRGLYEKEDKMYTKNSIFNRYTSFSENIDFAKSFAQTKKILVLSHSIGGFNYSEYLIREMNKLRKEDAEEYDSVDGDFMIDTAKEEAEWIFNIGSNFQFIKTVVQDGYTFIYGNLLQK